MKTYIIKTTESETWKREYRVKAESEQEAKHIIMNCQWELTELVDDDYVDTDWREIQSIEEEKE